MKSMSHWLTGLFFAGILVALLPLLTPLQAASLVVNSLADTDDGACDAVPDCTLREAINQANANAGPDTITFSVTGVISTTGLPLLTDDGTIVDASTVFGAGPLGAGAPGIELHGPPTDDSVGFLIRGASGVRISGFFITGFGDGVRLELGASNNIIGTNADGTRDTEERNVISGVTGDGDCGSPNRCDGVEINGETTSGNIVAGNFIGTNVSGTAALGNGDHGIYINNAPDNIVGGSTPATRNIISANGFNGICIGGGGAMSNTISGNYVGTDVTGTLDLGNESSGIYVNASGNTIGGTASGEGNVISGNTYGLGIDSGGENTAVLGNFIGTDATGTHNIGNYTGVGIFMFGTGNSNVTIGGTVAGARNIISGNEYDGIRINADGVTVKGNYIGTDVSGTAKIGNDTNGNGIVVRGYNNIIGGTSEAARNIISGNSTGILLFFGGRTVVQGNYIGTDVSGMNDLGNELGIFIQYSFENIIGGPEPGAGNLISGNFGIGIWIVGRDNTISGNIIGLDVTGTTPLGNSGDGVRLLSNYSFGNLIGGTTAGAGNLIGGNGGGGISIGRAGGNVVVGNYIGTDASGTVDLGNGQNGIDIEGVGPNIIGGTTPGEGNTIAFNGGAGVSVQNSTGHGILANAIFANAGLGIDLDADGVTPNDAGDADAGANNLQNFPVLTSTIRTTFNTTITGTLHSTPTTTFNLEFFSNSVCDPSDHGEGEKFLGSKEVTTDSSGNVDFVATWPTIVPSNHFSMTATATDPDNNTSEFSPCAPIDRGVSEPPPGTTYAKVVSEDGQPVAGAQVYWQGEPVLDPYSGKPQKTDTLGNIPLEGLEVQPGDTLVALAQQVEQPTVRDAHDDGWAYRTYLTNIEVDAAGNTQPFIVSGPGEQRLVVRRENTLVLFNLVVSVEWDATDDYLQDVVTATQKAADFLYDVTDGQMTFGQVAIYDNAAHWTEADIQISTKNIVYPHAYVGGITADDPSHLIRVGRFWDGNSGNQGNWSEDNGFRTLVHQFGHYGLGLYDEYFGYDVVGGKLVGRHDAFCTGQENRNPDTEATNASLMDYHYTSSELADVGRWTAWCQATAQHQLNNGEADWQTLLRLYSDASGQDRWQLVTPDQRAGPANAVSGPDTVPAALPFPEVSIDNTDLALDPFTLAVCRGGQPYLARAWVTLYRLGGQTIDQGLTNFLGQLEILGARSGDTLQAISMDGALSGRMSVLPPQPGDCLELDTPVSRDAAPGEANGPYLRLWPTTDNNGLLNGLHLVATRTHPDDYLIYVLSGSDEIGPTGALSYHPDTNNHQVQVSFSPAALLSGHVRVLGFQAGQSSKIKALLNSVNEQSTNLEALLDQADEAFVDLNVDYRLQRANHSQTDLFSNDGNLKLHLDTDSLPSNEVHFLISSPWGLPGPPPMSDIIGETYEIVASNNIIELEKPAVLRFRYDSVINLTTERSPGIYHWDFDTSTWQHLGGEVDLAQRQVVITVTKLGLYALMGDLATPEPFYYLPFIGKL